LVGAVVHTRLPFTILQLVCGGVHGWPVGPRGGTGEPAALALPASISAVNSAAAPEYRLLIESPRSD
jgi:hypothetical protein